MRQGRECGAVRHAPGVSGAASEIWTSLTRRCHLRTVVQPMSRGAFSDRYFPITFRLGVHFLMRASFALLENATPERRASSAQNCETWPPAAHPATRCARGSDAARGCCRSDSTAAAARAALQAGRCTLAVCAKRAGAVPPQSPALERPAIDRLTASGHDGHRASRSGLGGAAAAHDRWSIAPTVC